MKVFVLAAILALSVCIATAAYTKGESVPLESATTSPAGTTFYFKDIYGQTVGVSVVVSSIRLNSVSRGVSNDRAHYEEIDEEPMFGSFFSSPFKSTNYNYGGLDFFSWTHAASGVAKTAPNGQELTPAVGEAYMYVGLNETVSGSYPGQVIYDLRVVGENGSRVMEEANADGSYHEGGYWRMGEYMIAKVTPASGSVYTNKGNCIVTRTINGPSGVTAILAKLEVFIDESTSLSTSVAASVGETTAVAAAESSTTAVVAAAEAAATSTVAAAEAATTSAAYAAISSTAAAAGIDLATYMASTGAATTEAVVASTTGAAAASSTSSVATTEAVTTSSVATTEAATTAASYSVTSTTAAAATTSTASAATVVLSTFVAVGAAALLVAF